MISKMTKPKKFLLLFDARTIVKSTITINMNNYAPWLLKLLQDWINFADKTCLLYGTK